MRIEDISTKKLEQMNRSWSADKIATPDKKIQEKQDKAKPRRR